MRIGIRKITVLTTGVRMKKYILLMTVLIFSVFSFIGSAGAMGFDLGPDTSLSCNVLVSYGIGVRASERDRRLLRDPTTDDGNQNFDQWDLINNKYTVLADIELKHKDVGLFIRPKAFWDFVYMNDNHNDSPDSNNALKGDLIHETDAWPDKVEDIHGRDAEVLDLFGYIDSSLFDRNFSLRVGRQVISWGESLMLVGGISSAQNPMDLSAATAAGTQVKEILLPTGSVYLQMEITPDLALNGYFKWEWEKDRFFEGGTFFSPADMLDEVRAPMLAEVVPGTPLLVIPRAKDDEAKESGQYGIGLTYVLPGLEATEVGAYYINYHDRTPLINMIMGALLPERYYISYIEDVKLYGVSVSSLIGDTNVSGELSYRDDVGFQSYNELEIPIVEMGDYWQAQVSAIWLRSLPFFAEQVVITGEAGCGREREREDNHFSWGYMAQVSFDWFQVLPAWDAGLNLVSAQTINDSSRFGQEGYDAFSIGVDFVYDVTLKGALVYENRYNKNYARDRDTLIFTVSYEF